MTDDDFAKINNREFQFWKDGYEIGYKRGKEDAVRHGHWVKDKNLYKCTACNDLLTVAGWADCIPEKQIYTAFKYCPNCGALMDLDESDV